MKGKLDDSEEKARVFTRKGLERENRGGNGCCDRIAVVREMVVTDYQRIYSTESR